METSSTDRRLDDFSDRLGRFEDRVDDRFDKTVTKEQFEMATAETKERFGRVEASITGLGERMDDMNRTITGSFLTIVAAVIIKLFIT
jgi:hypothetical protein